MARPIPRVPPVTTATLAMVSSRYYWPHAFAACGPPYPIALIARDTHRNPHPPTDAQGGEALLGVALLHLVEQGDENPRDRGADRVAERDRPAIDVELVGIEAQIFTDRAGLRGEGLVGLDEVGVADRPAGFVQGHAASGDRPTAHDRRVDPGGRP